MEALLEVDGEDLSGLDHEAGGHRVQRVPASERQGRVHSSTATVAVLNPSQAPKLDLLERDLRVEWFSGTGSGGQHRNKHQNCCRLIHLPSGLEVRSQRRSRAQSLQEARDELAARLLASQASLHQRAAASIRRGQLGSGERGDKIRTWRFQDDQVIDHRSGARMSAALALDGHLSRLWPRAPAR